MSILAHYCLKQAVNTFNSRYLLKTVIMKSTQHPILVALGLLVIAGALLFATSCGPEKHKIDDSTVLPFKDKAELDSLLDFPILPEYTIEEYYTKTDFVNGDERFVVCCKFLEEVTPAEVQKIVAEVDSYKYPGWSTFDLGRENNMRLFFDLDTTMAADWKRPDILGERIHVEIEIPCRKNDSWKGFEVVFRNDRADYSVVVNRDTLSRVLGVELPPLTETSRSDEYIYYKFDTIPAEEFYQALEKAPNWTVSHHDDITFYDYDNDDGNVWITADLIKGEPEFSFHREKSIGAGGGEGIFDMIKRYFSSFSDKKAEE